MSLPVRFVFELVGEVAASWTVGVGGVFCGEGAGAVDEVHGVDYWGRGDAFDCGAEGEEEGGFFETLVRGHAAIYVSLGEMRSMIRNSVTEGKAYMYAK